MKRLSMVVLVALVVAFSISVCSNTASVGLVNVADPALTHFGTFNNQESPGDYSGISGPEAIANADFGWHTHYVTYPAYGGILLDEGHTVTKLRLQVHYNPFENFVLQGSTNTADGTDGDWVDLLTGTVAHAQTELAWNEWTFSNTVAYSAYRIQMLGDYFPGQQDNGWAMYRWQLLADDSLSPVPEPASMLLLGFGLVGLAALRGRSRQA